MSSLKDKFDDYREEPRSATWQKLLERLDTEMPVKRKRKYGVWIMPLLVTGMLATAWIWYMNTNQGVKSSAAPSSMPDNTIVASQQEAATPVATPAVMNHNVVATPVTAESQTAPVAPSHPVMQQPIASGMGSVSPVITASTPQNLAQYHPISKLNFKALQWPFQTLKVRDQSLSFNRFLSIATPYDEEIAQTDKIDSSKNTASAPPVKPNNSPENKFVLEIYYAPGISNIMLKDPLMPLFPSKSVAENKALRKSISKVGFSFTTGFGVKMNINKDFRMKTGYYLTQVNQSLYYNAEASICNCKTAQLSTLDPKITESNMSNLTDTISEGNNFTANNKYAFREIPLLFEYAVTKTKRINSVATFGISYMYLRGLNIKMPDADNVGFLNIVTKTADVNIFPSYKDAFNLILGYGLIYNAKKNVEWSLAPQFKVALTSVSQDVHWFREYPWQFHVGVGVGKRF